MTTEARQKAWDAISPDDRDGLNTFNHGFDCGYDAGLAAKTEGLPNREALIEKARFAIRGSNITVLFDTKRDEDRVAALMAGFLLDYLDEKVDGWVAVSDPCEIAYQRLREEWKRDTRDAVMPDRDSFEAGFNAGLQAGQSPLAAGTQSPPLFPVDNYTIPDDLTRELIARDGCSCCGYSPRMQVDGMCPITAARCPRADWQGIPPAPEGGESGKETK